MKTDPIEDQFFVALQALQQLQDSGVGEPFYAIVECWIEGEELTPDQFNWLNERAPSRRTQLIAGGGLTQPMREWDYFADFQPESEASEKTLRRAVYYFVEVISASLEGRRAMRIRRCPFCKSFFLQPTARKKFCDDFCRVRHNNQQDGS